MIIPKETWNHMAEYDQILFIRRHISPAIPDAVDELNKVTDIMTTIDELLLQVEICIELKFIKYDRENEQIILKYEQDYKAGALETVVVTL